MFSNTRINDLIETISIDAVGGPQFNTTVVATAAGAEQRNVNWSLSRGRWEFGNRIVNEQELETLLDFFQQVAGKAGSFRFKDFGDNKVRPGSGFVKATPKGLRLVKRYGAGALARERFVTLPNPGFVLRVGGVVTPATVDPISGVLAVEGGGDPASMTWVGTFDLRARFDTDQVLYAMRAYEAPSERAFFDLQSVPVVELQ